MLTLKVRLGCIGMMMSIILLTSTAAYSMFGTDTALIIVGCLILCFTGLYFATIG